MARIRGSQRIITGFLIISGILAFLYVSVSISVVIIISNRPLKPITRAPSSLGLNYRDVTFLSREDHLLLCGWLIPGILPDGRLTVERWVFGSVTEHILGVTRLPLLIARPKEQHARTITASMQLEAR